MKTVSVVRRIDGSKPPSPVLPDRFEKIE